LPRDGSEPAKIYWAIGIAASLAFHASGVAGAVLLADRYVEETVPTEITFSGQASPAAKPVPAQAEVATATETARVAEQEKLQPSVAETTAKATTEALQPLETGAVGVAAQEKLAPSAAEAPAKPVAETLQPVETDAERPAEAPPSLRPEAAADAVAEAVQPVAPLEAQPGSRPESAAVVSDGDTVAAADAAAAAVQPVAPLEAQPGSRPESAAVVSDGDTVAAADAAAAAVQPVAPLEAQPGSRPESAAVVSDGDTVAAADAAAAAVQPVAPLEAQPESQPESAAVVSDGDTLVASDSSERLTSSAPGAAAVSGQPAEKVAALEQSTSESTVPAIVADQPAPTARSESRPAQVVGALSAAEPASEPATTLKPEVLQPQPLDAGTEPPAGAATRPEVLGPTAGPLDADAESVPVAPDAPQAVKPVEEPVETALLVPARPDSSLGTEVDKPSDRYRRIVEFIRRYGGGDCFIALPAMSADGAVTFQTFGRDKVREDAFRQALFEVNGFEAEISSGNVADPQCLALSFARGAKRYPGFSLMIDLDEAEVASGTALSGSVLNAGGRELHLLLVDDEGRVQSLDNLLAAGDGTDRPFSTPLTLTGGPVATKQILIAIATDDPLAALAAPVDEPANAYFKRLGQEIAATGADVDLAVEGFSVR
jgi:hypothetical protein